MVKKRVKRLNQPAWMTQDILTALKMRENAMENKTKINIGIGETKIHF